jgi:sugar (pentulose or hexulose) kinase
LTVLALEVGSSSVRAVLYSEDGRREGDTQARLQYRARSTADGAAEIDADELLSLIVRVTDETLSWCRRTTPRP